MFKGQKNKANSREVIDDAVFKITVLFEVLAYQVYSYMET